MKYIQVPRCYNPRFTHYSLFTKISAHHKTATDGRAKFGVVGCRRALPIPKSPSPAGHNAAPMNAVATFLNKLRRRFTSPRTQLDPPPRIRDISDPSQSRPLLGQAPRWRRRCAGTNFSGWTNMPPEPQQGSKMLSRYCRGWPLSWVFGVLCSARSSPCASRTPKAISARRAASCSVSFLVRPCVPS